MAMTRCLRCGADRAEWQATSCARTTCRTCAAYDAAREDARIAREDAVRLKLERERQKGTTR